MDDLVSSNNYIKPEMHMPGYGMELSVVLTFYILQQGVPCGKCQRGEFVYLLWNVPIQIFAICYIILEVYNGFRSRKTFKKTLAHSRLSLLLSNNKMA